MKKLLLFFLFVVLLYCILHLLVTGKKNWAYNVKINMCRGHQLKIYEGIKLFGKEKGRYPDNLKEIIGEFPQYSKNVECPVKFWKRRSGEIEYEYVPGYYPTDKKTAIFLYDKYCHSKSRTPIIFITLGNGEWKEKLHFDQRCFQLFLSLENMDSLELLKLIDFDNYFIRTKSIIILAEKKDKNAVKKLMGNILYPQKWTIEDTYPNGPIVIDEEESTYILYWALKKITGENFGRDKGKWLKWWDQNKDNF